MFEERVLKLLNENKIYDAKQLLIEAIMAKTSPCKDLYKNRLALSKIVYKNVGARKPAINGAYVKMGKQVITDTWVMGIYNEPMEGLVNAFHHDDENFTPSVDRLFPIDYYNIPEYPFDIKKLSGLLKTYPKDTVLIKICECYYMLKKELILLYNSLGEPKVVCKGESVNNRLYMYSEVGKGIYSGVYNEVHPHYTIVDTLGNIIKPISEDSDNGTS